MPIDFAVEKAGEGARWRSARSWLPGDILCPKSRRRPLSFAFFDAGAGRRRGPRRAGNCVLAALDRSPRRWYSSVQGSLQVL